jgi:hypothetical protein
MSVPTKLQGERVVFSRSIGAADAATTVIAIDIPAGTLIPAYGVSVWVKTAMTGGTPSYTVGDSTAVDTWLASADITEATAGLYNSVAQGASPAGKYYAAADSIKIVITTGLTSGECFVIARMIDVSDFV